MAVVLSGWPMAYLCGWYLIKRQVGVFVQWVPEKTNEHLLASRQSFWLVPFEKACGCFRAMDDKENEQTMLKRTCILLKL